MTLPSKTWQRRNGFGPIWEFPLVVVMLGLSIAVLIVVVDEAVTAGFPSVIAFALALAAAVSTSVVILLMVGLLLWFAQIRK